MISQIDSRIQRALGSIRRAFRGIGQLIDTSGPVMLMDGEGLAGDDLRGAEIMQHYGITTVPPAGYMFVSIPIGGKTSHSIIVATEHGTYRLKGLKTGEVALYSDEGDSVVLKRGRLIEVTTQTFRINAEEAIEFNAPKITNNASSKVENNTPLVTASGDMKVDKDITDCNASQPKTMRGMREAYEDHDHDENNVDGSPTNKPNQHM